MINLENRRYARLVAALVTAWLAVAVLASALGILRTDAASLPIPLAAAALCPIAVFASAYAASPAFRQFVLSLDARILTVAHTWRIGGFLFLVLATYGILPKIFALPAGWGDISIGLTAPLVAMYLSKPEHRRGFIAWQILGTLDLVMAVSLGILGQVLGYGPQMEPMSVLPLSLVPTFAVPLLVILHIICIAQARRWTAPAHSRVGEQFVFSTA